MEFRTFYSRIYLSGAISIKMIGLGAVAIASITSTTSPMGEYLYWVVGRSAENSLEMANLSARAPEPTVPLSSVYTVVMFSCRSSKTIFALNSGV